MQIAEVIARLKAEVPAFRTVEGAVELAALMQSNALAQWDGWAAYVIPVGIRGGSVDSATGLFIQSTDEVVGVLLIARNSGRTGADILGAVSDVIDATFAAMCGWGPDSAPGVFRLLKAGVQSLSGGTFTYNIEFAIGDQLRIAT